MKYQTILADPPWPIKWNASAAIGKKHIEYPTMPISEICALPIYEIADTNCTLFLWTTNSFLPEALGVLRHWKFSYKMLFTWCKNNGMGGHPRNATEHMIIATRGEPLSNRHANATLNWIEHPRAKHSEKPAIFRSVIEKISPAPRIELFARQRIVGWDAWGNEVDSDITLNMINGLTNPQAWECNGCSIEGKNQTNIRCPNCGRTQEESDFLLDFAKTRPYLTGKGDSKR